MENPAVPEQLRGVLIEGAPVPEKDSAEEACVLREENAVDGCPCRFPESESQAERRRDVLSPGSEFYPARAHPIADPHRAVIQAEIKLPGIGRRLKERELPLRRDRAASIKPCARRGRGAGHPDPAESRRLRILVSRLPLSVCTPGTRRKLCPPGTRRIRKKSGPRDARKLCPRIPENEGSPGIPDGDTFERSGEDYPALGAAAKKQLLDGRKDEGGAHPAPAAEKCRKKEQEKPIPARIFQGEKAPSAARLPGQQASAAALNHSGQQGPATTAFLRHPAKENRCRHKNKHREKAKTQQGKKLIRKKRRGRGQDGHPLPACPRPLPLVTQGLSKYPRASDPNNRSFYSIFLRGKSRLSFMIPLICVRSCYSDGTIQLVSRSNGFSREMEWKETSADPPAISCTRLTDFSSVSESTIAYTASVSVAGSSAVRNPVSRFT